MDARGVILKNISLVICAGMLVLNAAALSLANIIYVDKNNASGVEDGSIENPFNTIGEAITFSASGDIVKVAAGLYLENVSINSKAIKLQGEDPAVTTIQGTSNVIIVDGTYSEDNVEISGFTITQGSNSGIRLNSSTLQVLIRNNIVLGNGIGILCSLTKGTNILNNTITQNTGYGINIVSTDNNSIVGNIITSNNDCGIYEQYGTALVTYNNLWSNMNGDTCYYNPSGFTKIENISTNPQFLESTFFLSVGSLSIDRGSPLSAYKDPDGTRNDQGVYGGPGAANYWPSPAGGPVVTVMSVSPPSVSVGGTITLKATGKIR